ncbi:lysophosphatidylserine lipase ABHD12-like [Anthonomus grandis grandis]|uniref:lysophosphatidylserine lipase ABHD12-like n=1 Tax=Anthonomus grandis grandis TaxID=2921223 RepID=UPI002165AADC|nr:lysophosphatidylserine lipase ABHD12-like [Anthonomus grandis grandis]XP_050300211.1 lysophosphatidylserine lipase ABHD12-like [Anthonomus grandis grandis]
MEEHEAEEFPYRSPDKCKNRKIMFIIIIVFFGLLLIGFILVFVVFPLVFMNSITLQQTLVFTRWNLLTNKTAYKKFRFPAYKQHYVEVEDLGNKPKLNIGIWHVLPIDLAMEALVTGNIDYDKALKDSKYDVLLYFHGTGEDRTQNIRKYQIFRLFFHIIAFDYRGYGDSDEGDMFEKNIINDCSQIYRWLQNRTNSSIYIWGHSLGTSISVSTIKDLGSTANISGLVLESAFTTFKNELYHHPYVKYFTWLPWFQQTVVNPLHKNGFIFDTASAILNVSCPILFLHAKDDSIVPYFMSQKLYKISRKRNVDESIINDTRLILFDKALNLDHYKIYQDSYTVFFMMEFFKIKHSKEKMIQSSHQS